MKNIYIFVTCLIIMNFPVYLFAEENVIRFSDILWGISPEHVILIEGLPDSITYHYDDNGEAFQIVSESVWVNSTSDDNSEAFQIASEIVWAYSTSDDNDLIKYENTNNISIGIDLNEIISGHNKISFRYNNILCFNISTTIFLRFENGKYCSISYIFDIENLTENNKNDIAIILQNYYFQLYGTPVYISQYNKNIDSVWFLDDTMIILYIFLPQNDTLYSEYNYIDVITVYYSYIENN